MRQPNIVNAENISDSNVQQAGRDINNFYYANPKVDSETREKINAIYEQICVPSNAKKLNDDHQDSKLHGQITALQGLINVGDVNPALKSLLNLKQNEWDKASNPEKYSLLIAIASAKIKLGENIEAGKLIIEAYPLSPESEKSEQNLATAYLMLQDYPNAIKHAKEVLSRDEKNSYAASILIQALVIDDKCKDPLSEIPEALHDSEDVLVGYIQYLRVIGDSRWTEIAVRAYEIHPDKNDLKLFYADAILDSVINKNKGNKERGIINIAPSMFQEAVDILYCHALSAIDTYSELIPTVVSNAALALRLANEIPKSREILDMALVKRPDDFNLKLQRAVIARIDNDSKGVLERLEGVKHNPEVVGLKFGALVDLKLYDDALILLDGINEDDLPIHVMRQLLLDRVHLHIERDEREQALKIVNERILKKPDCLEYRVVKVKTYRIIGEVDSAVKTLKQTVEMISESTDFSIRAELAFEADRLDLKGIIVELLNGKLDFTYDTEELRLFIVACIKEGYWATAKRVMEELAPTIKDTKWFKKIEALFAYYVGDISMLNKIDAYLELYPDDVNVILAKIGLIQRTGDDKKVDTFLKSLDLDKINGQPEQCAELATMICHYSEANRGMKFAYKILMNNWDIPKIHMAYQSLILLNSKLFDDLHCNNIVEDETVVSIKNESGTNTYRIEKVKYLNFNEERISDELLRIVAGKHVGDKVVIQDSFGTKTIEIVKIESIYWNAYERSLLHYEKAFPYAKGIRKFYVDPDDFNLEEIKSIIRTRSEENAKLIAIYKTGSLPLIFLAKLTGVDPIGVCHALHGEQIAINTSIGHIQERKIAIKNILENGDKGCVLDALTISQIRRLKIKKEVESVCGKLYTTQSVIDVFSTRYLHDQQFIDSKQGFLAWRNNTLVFTEYTKRDLKRIARESKEELDWVKDNVGILTAIPKTDLSSEIRDLRSRLGTDFCDPAIASEFNAMLLLSDDLGFRVWAKDSFTINTAWIQPVLMLALSTGRITNEAYYDAVNNMVFNGQTYISLDANCLMHKVIKDNYTLTKDLSKMLAMIGGKRANIRNIKVLTEFIKILSDKCMDEVHLKKITGEAFSRFMDGRTEGLDWFIAYVLSELTYNHRLSGYCHDWLIGHSIGMPYFNELVSLH